MLIAIIVWLFHPHVDMLQHQYPVWWQFYLVALAFIYITIRIGKWLLLFEQSLLQWFGKNSLTIMCIHAPIVRIILKIMSITTGFEITTIRTSEILSILAMFLTIIFLIPFTIGINRYVPFLSNVSLQKHHQSNSSK